MLKNNILYAIVGLVLFSACSNVKVALYDKEKSKSVVADTKASYKHSKAYKTIAYKEDFLNTAEDYLGTPYKYGSTDPSKGFDCSGFVSHVGSKNNLTLPRSSGSMAQAAPHIPWEKASPGDLVFFGVKNHIDHVGIVQKNKTGALWVIHSTTQQGVITEDVLVSPYWKKRILFAIDLVEFLEAQASVKS